MELVIEVQDIEPLPKPKPEPFVFNSEGLLTSVYKQEINDNFFHSNPKSVFGIKQAVKRNQYELTSGIDAILKLSVFTIALALMLG